MARAIRLLARRELSREALRERLLTRGLGRRRPADEDAAAPQVPVAEIDRVLDELERMGYLSDQRFAGMVVRQEANRHGDRRIRQSLQMRGIDRDVAQEALGALQGTEPQRARALWERRFGALSADRREYARQYAFLVRRGFRPDVVVRVLGAVRAGGAPDDADGGFDPDDIQE